MNHNQEQFIKFIRTKMAIGLKTRKSEDESTAVHIPSNEIEEIFFRVNRRSEIQELIDLGELKVIQVGKSFHYKALKPGAINIDLIPKKDIPDNIIFSIMIQHLKNVSLPIGKPSTDYFDRFLKYIIRRPDLFFKVSKFSGRVFTPVTGFHNTHRPNILLYNKPTIGLDVCQMQPLLLSKIIFNAIGANDYTAWINDGVDIYIKLQDITGLKTRDEATKKLYEILFSYPSDELAKLFGDSAWIDWVNKYKSLNEPRNPNQKFDKNGTLSYHNNLAWLLQTTEVSIMTQVWIKLVDNQIPFLSVHDEIIVQEENANKALELFSDILSKEVPNFKINCEKKVLLEPSLPTLPTLIEEPLQLIPAHILALHKRFTDAETNGLLDNRPDREYISKLWECVMMYTHKPSIQSLYLRRLEQLNIENNELLKTA